MDKISFAFLPDALLRPLVQTRIIVNEKDILSAIGENLLGIIASEFFQQKALRSNGELTIGRCSCGIATCRDTAMIVTRLQDQIIWTARDIDSTAWATRDPQSGKLDRFTFARAEYDIAIEVGSNRCS